jgi:hypothetical protein
MTAHRSMPAIEFSAAGQGTARPEGSARSGTRRPPNPSPVQDNRALLMLFTMALGHSQVVLNNILRRQIG